MKPDGPAVERSADTDIDIGDIPLGLAPHDTPAGATIEAAERPPGRHSADRVNLPLPGLAGYATIAAIEALLGWLGFVQGAGAYSISPVWPAAGFGLAVVTVYGYRVLPALLLGAGAVIAWQGIPWPATTWLTLTVGLGAALGACLLRSLVPRLGTREADAGDALRYLLLAVGLTPATSALVGTTGLLTFGELPASQWSATVGTWLLGDAVGVVTVGTFTLAWLKPQRRREAFRRPREGAALAVLTAVFTALACWLWDALPAAGHLHWELAVLPLVLWGALRFGVVGAATATLIMAIGLTGAGAFHLGPYGEGTIGQIHGLQLFLGVGASVSLMLGVTISRSELLRRRARAEADFIRSIGNNLPGAIFRRFLSRDGYLSYPYMAGRFAPRFGLDDLADGQPVALGPGRRPGALRRIMAEDYESFHERLIASAEHLEPLEMELRFLDEDGGYRWARSISRPQRVAGGGVIWDGILLDITEEKEQRARAEHLALHDTLTGLLNRSGLQEFIGPALSRALRQQHSAAFCLIDVDRFKEINDSHGHSTGDELLQMLAERIREVTRLEDVKARFGGDELIVIQTDVQDERNVVAGCRRLLARLREPYELGDLTLTPGISLGVAMFPRDADSEESLLVAADRAMYKAKAGDPSPVFYNPDMGHEARQRSELTRDLTEAIHRRELTVHYQPQIHVASGKVSGVEALARWHHPEHGWVSPGRFIPVAEERGLISSLDLLVLEKVLEDVADWQTIPGFEFPVAINLSGASLRDPLHRDQLVALVQASGVPTGRVVLELTESTLVHATDDRVTEGLRSLALLGIRFAADDFGTGYGSLTYLRTLPITRIKIDRSFVQGAPLRTEDAEVVRALLQLTRNLNLHTIAEGVETREELDKLTELGCSHVQGFYYARPMPRDALEDFVESCGSTDVVMEFAGDLI